MVLAEILGSAVMCRLHSDPELLAEPPLSHPLYVDMIDVNDKDAQGRV